jgi:hypothetical protein
MTWTAARRLAQAARMACLNRARKGQPRTPFTEAHLRNLSRGAQRRRRREERAA